MRRRFPDVRVVIAIVGATLGAAGCYDMHGRVAGDLPADSGPARPHDAEIRADAPPIAFSDTWAPPPPPPPPADGGAVCSEPPLPGFASALTCPESVAPGEIVVVTLSHYAGACCADSGALRTVVRPGRDTPDFGLLPQWNACECCLECACVGGAATEVITLGSFSAGDVVGVTAGDLHCSIPISSP